MKRTGCVKISDNTEQMFGYEKLIFQVVEKRGKKGREVGEGAQEERAKILASKKRGIA